ncbi:unnamed protein product [Miscanthus lutarioriparius]|uniref:Uncharacterized protein n=1 Tax=Miscanthus lutarioriparius TaxID=422564 RepID=A0A811NPZ8_9POAL|nr:unnamed protein product [Miscanthus lutarioriparius]
MWGECYNSQGHVLGKGGDARNIGEARGDHRRYLVADVARQLCFSSQVPVAGSSGESVKALPPLSASGNTHCRGVALAIADATATNEMATAAAARRGERRLRGCYEWDDLLCACTEEVP